MSLIYEVCCNNCGQILEVTDVALDKDYDLSLVVEACENCTNKSYDQGVEDTKKEEE